MRSPANFPRKAGFSLVEVVLALGIIAFAFTTILGLLSVGMNTFRDAIESTVRSKIVANLTHRATQTEFASLGQFALPVAATDLANVRLDPSQARMYYYTDEGVELTEAERSRSVYTVAAFYLPASPLPGAATASTNLATVRLDVYANRGGFPLTADGPGKTTTLVRVANFGQRL